MQISLCVFPIHIKLNTYVSSAVKEDMLSTMVPGAVSKEHQNLPCILILLTFNK